MTSFNSLYKVLSSKKFFGVFTNKVKLHHSLYKELKIKAGMFEELLSSSLREVSGLVTLWDVGSHKTGKDVVFNNIRISCKSGVVNRSGILSLSGSRTTTHKTIEEKVNFISQNHDDFVLTLSECGDMYKMFIIPSKLLGFGKPSEWIHNKTHWKFESSVMSCKIKKCMSDQLWMYIDTNHPDIHCLLEVKAS